MSDIDACQTSVTFKISDSPAVKGEIVVAITANPPFPKDRRKFSPAQTLASEAGAVLVGHPALKTEHSADNPNLVPMLLAAIEDCDCSDYASATSKIYEVIELIKAAELKKVDALLLGRSAL